MAELAGTTVPTAASFGDSFGKGASLVYKIDDIQRTVTHIASALPLTRVVLVGSYARNTASEQSDIDLVIDGEDLSEAYWDFLFKAEDAFSTPIDVLTTKGLANSVIRDSVLEGGIVLYEA
jgi:predicted nucleotidyltransferase